MAGFLDKFKIKTGIEKNTRLDLSCQHITTANFMELQPVYVKEMVPGESLEVLQSTFTRLSPLAVPTLGNANIHNRAFFIPMRTIFKRWDEFITQSSSALSNAGSGSGSAINMQSVPTIQNHTLVHFFLGDTGHAFSIPYNPVDPTYSNRRFVTGISSTDTEAQENADIVFTMIPDTEGNLTSQYYNFTPLGRQVYKILQSLGYNIIWNGFSANGRPVSTGPNYKKWVDVSYSAMPLLAYFKVMLDWYWPSQYVGSYQYNMIDSALKYDGYSGSGEGLDLTTARLIAMFANSNRMSVNYDSDYLISAFDNPVGQRFESNTRNNRITDITLSEDDRADGYDAYVQTNSENTPQITSFYDDGEAGYKPGVISQYALNALKSMTDYMQRHNLVGVRALDRFYARFGISLGSEKLNRSNYIGSNNIPLQFGDVMSNADTDGAALGSFAGKGLGYGEQKFSYTSDDYGFFVICSSIVPVASTFEGLDRTVLHKSPLDFWTPEYDQLGNQAISKMEVYIPMHDNAEGSGTPSWEFNNTDLSTGIFGYTPRYSEYKIGRDKITGDFRYKSLSNVGETSSAWYLNRSLSGWFPDAASIVHSETFVRGMDADQYNRIFNIESDENDKFYMIHNFNVISNSPMRSLYDTYDFDGGKEVVGDVNGVKVN